MIQQFSDSIKHFFDSKPINFLNPLSVDELQSLETYYMNNLDLSPSHFHNDTVCKSPNLTYVFSYSRNYITFKDNSVIEGTIDIPVFYCENCDSYNAILPLHFIVPYCQYSIPFILCVLLDKFHSRLTVNEIVNKYDISVSTLYRWMDKHSSLLHYYQQLRNRYCTSMFVSLLYFFKELLNDLFDVTGFTLFQSKRKLNKSPPMETASQNPIK